tara:strand:+ start:975 stop:2060 length:1086 start_codon:yes stop_codon:yes gene_type:complete
MLRIRSTIGGCLLALSSASALRMAIPVRTVGTAATALPRHALVAMAEEAAADEKEDRLGAGGRGGHAVPNQPELDESENKVQIAVMEHQRGAARLSMAEDAKSLVAYSSGYAVLSTLSSSVAGYPNGALVGFAPDANGLPVFVFSSMSSHTKDLNKGDGQAALCVTAKGFEGAADGRVTLIGDVTKCSKEEVEADGLKELYKKSHPNAFWVDFGDFQFFRMSELKAVNFVGGFARAASPTPDEYLGAEVDAIQAFAAPVMGHMNSDHSDSTIAMVQHYIGLPEVTKADLVSLDKLGFQVQVERKGQQFKVRLPFPRAANDRKDVKTLIVEMTQASLANEDVQAYLQQRAEAAKAEEPAAAA